MMSNECPEGGLFDYSDEEKPKKRETKKEPKPKKE